MLRYEYVLAHRVAVAIILTHGIRTTCFVATGECARIRYVGKSQSCMVECGSRDRATDDELELPCPVYQCRVGASVCLFHLLTAVWLAFARVLCFHKPTCWVSCCCPQEWWWVWRLPLLWARDRDDRVHFDDVPPACNSCPAVAASATLDTHNSFYDRCHWLRCRALALHC